MHLRMQCCETHLPLSISFKAFIIEIAKLIKILRLTELSNSKKIDMLGLTRMSSLAH